MSDWRPYFGDRLRRDDPIGFSVVIPKERQEPIPLFCPVCHLIFQSSEDAEYFRSRSCCSKCGMKWADPDVKRWETGWRPSPDEIAQEVKLRQSMPISLNLDALGD